MGVVRRFWFGGLVLAIAAMVISIQPARAKAPSLSLPLECIARQSCFIQNYVDVDASSGISDYRCGMNSYNGHKGVDFRILSIAAMKKGVAVLASAPGTVMGWRDGMADRLISGRTGRGIKGRECGNGLVIDHGDGWETQYCHMRKGSLKVKKGLRVKRGQKLGLIGLSGQTAFPHVHLAVRHKGKVVDPFNGATPSRTACKATGNTLWRKKLLHEFPPVPGQPFIWGFANRPVGKKLLMLRGRAPLPASTRARALVFFGQALNLKKGDQLGIKLSGPKSVIARSLSKPMNRHKASFLSYAGKKRRGFAWPVGTYKGTFSLWRGGKLLWQKTKTLELK